MTVVGCIGMQLEMPCLPLSFSMPYELKHGIDEWCKFLGLYTRLSDSGWIDAELFKGWFDSRIILQWMSTAPSIISRQYTSQKLIMF